MILAPVLRQRFFDSNNSPLAGGKLYTYAAGTTTPQATYTDQGGGTPNANPVVLDSSGYADVWIDPSFAYKFILKDSNDVQQWSKDNVSSAATTGIEGWNATSNYSSGAIVSDASGAGLLYVSLSDNNAGNSLSNVTYWRMFGGKIRTVTANTTLLVSDELVRSNSTSGNLTHTLPACSSTPIGKRITVKDVGTGGNTTSVRGASTDTIDGIVTYATALARYDSLTVVNNGTTWDIVPNLIPDGAVKTAKIATNAVTQDKLQARATGTSVAAGGLAISSGSAAFNTASATAVDVTNLSVTIVTTGRPVALYLIPDPAAIGASNDSWVGPSLTSIGYLYLVRDVTTLIVGSYSSNGGSARNGPGSFSYIDTPSAGSHTYKVQASNASGSSNMNVNYCKLVAYET